MTKEECIADLKSINATGMECIDYAIKALEQPSDDCVSRQAVLSKAELIELEDGQSFMSIDPEDVKALPPVTPTFPKGATNGDVIKAMFPNIEADEIKTNTGGYIEVKYLDTTDKRDATAFRKSWWNAPYKRGDLDGSN